MSKLTIVCAIAALLTAPQLASAAATYEITTDWNKVSGITNCGTQAQSYGNCASGITVANSGYTVNSNCGQFACLSGFYDSGNIQYGYQTCGGVPDSLKNDYYTKQAYIIFTGIVRGASNNSTIGSPCYVDFRYLSSCVSPKSSCSEGSSSSSSNGYIATKKTEWSCEEGCKTTTTYKCESGYYGTPNATGTSGCQPCPEATDFTAGAKPYSAGGSTAVSACMYMPGTTFSDSKGSGKINPTPCFY